MAASAGAAPQRRGLWQGRVAVLVGLVLLGIGLRHAVTLLSPLLGDVGLALGLGTAGKTFLGMLPTLSFGAAGFIAPVLARRFGAEKVALLAMVLAAAGTLARPFIDHAAVFMALTIVALVGMGFGNVVGAPLVKKYFPDRQATMITVFSLLMQAGATLPAMTAVPLANAFGWRVSLASWGLLSLAAVVPWALHLARGRQQAATVDAAAPDAAPKQGLLQLVANPVAAGTALFYAMASLNIYAMLAWMPTLMQQHLGLDRDAAGVAFSVYTFMTLPMAAITPIIANRMRDPRPLALLMAAVGPLGYLAIILGIGPAWFAALVAGLAGGAFPMAIAMFNLRTRTPGGSASLAGFAMGIGYLAGTLGPLLGGWLYAASGGWTLPLWVYVVTFVPMAIGGWMMARPGRYLEDASQAPTG